MPGHAELNGNEKSDMLARQGYSSLFVGPKSVYGILPCLNCSSEEGESIAVERFCNK